MWMCVNVLCVYPELRWETMKRYVPTGNLTLDTKTSKLATVIEY